MSEVIRIEGVSKRYRLGVINRRMLYEDIQARWARFRGVEDPTAPVAGANANHPLNADHLWALRDVSFSVNEGDVVGVIGRNGSGKSTLLKILSRITAPTEGRAMLKGHVASLLEVGTGFHPELTGRENVFLNGSILGMSKATLKRRYDEIVEFAGVEQFMETPVKRYSSGMKVRLAFAVAAHLDPEILIIDEVLAVGDAAFQQKCLGKIGSVARSGRTVLFVSHSAAAVENMCTRGVVLNNGRLCFEGSQTEALNFYSEITRASSAPLAEREDRTGTGELRIVDVKFKSTDGREIGSVGCGEEFDIYLYFENHSRKAFPNLVAEIRVGSLMDMPLLVQHNHLTGQGFGPIPPSGAFVVRVRDWPLAESIYRLSIFIASEFRRDALDYLPNALEFAVEGGDFYGTGQPGSNKYGPVLLNGDWRLLPDAPP